MSAPADRTIRIRGLSFHYLDWGGAPGKPLVLVHGAAQTAHSFDEVAPDLARDHHVLSIDQRGHGDTDWATDAAYEREEFVADLVAFLDAVRWPAAAFVAMSLGGINSMALAAAHPDRVSGLVIVDVVPTVERQGVQAIQRQLAAREFASFDEAVERAHAFNPRRSLENLRDRLSHSLKPMGDGRWTYKFDPGIIAGEADLEALWAKLPAIRCPVLLVRGAESPLLGREGAERFLATVRGAELAEVPGAGHSVMGDNPEGFLGAVRPFLGRHGL
ncbi:MAG: alpha/beta fold hydrolase [Candidatus Binatia bacterium]